jgi:hypothetical protein
MPKWQKVDPWSLSWKYNRYLVQNTTLWFFLVWEDMGVLLPKLGEACIGHCAHVFPRKAICVTHEFWDVYGGISALKVFVEMFIMDGGLVYLIIIWFFWQQRVW